MTPSATVDDVVRAAREHAGPLGQRLIDGALEVARRHGDDLDGLIEEIYARLLVREATDDPDGPMPEAAVAPPPEERIVVSRFAEQPAVALAGLVYGRGDFLRTMSGGAAFGLDTDSILTTAGTWIGGLVGRSGIPGDWVETLLTANPEVDLAGDARALAEVAVKGFREPALR